MKIEYAPLPEHLKAARRKEMFKLMKVILKLPKKYKINPLECINEVLKTYGLNEGVLKGMKTYTYNGKKYYSSSRDRLCRKLGFKPWDIEAKKIKKIKKGAK